MLIPLEGLFHRWGINRPCVFHLGANEGQEAETYNRCGVSVVIWVEAIPSVHKKLERNISIFPNQIALCACLSNEDGKAINFNVASNQAQSSSFLEFGTHSKEHPTVKFVDRLSMVTTRFDTLMARAKWKTDRNDWFLNVDLQGAELLAMQGMGDLIHLCRWVYVEVNEKELYRGCPLVSEIDGFLAGYGFKSREVKMTGNGWGDKFYSK
jgi:FkbM family methyltransferase